MKLGVTLIVLGILGILQYVCFQFTPLLSSTGYPMALNYGGVVTEKLYGPLAPAVITDIIWLRDWSLGIVGALIGAVLLSLGIIRLLKKRQAQIEEPKPIPSPLM